MAEATRLIDKQKTRRLGSRTSPLHFEEGDRPEFDVPGRTARVRGAGRRYLSLRGRHAFELSFWCGTCPLLFERLEGANETLSITSLEDRLNEGLARVDEDVVETASELVPEGNYLPLLLSVRPTLVYPGGVGDYFAEEQVATWGIDPFWGVPANPHTPYYRGDSRALGADVWLFEFIVPMVPPSWNDPKRVAVHAERLRESSRSTCLALSILDVREPAVSYPSANVHQAHHGLSHFLLDGHHKIQAAAEIGAAVQILSLLSLDASLAGETEMVELQAALSPGRRGRGPFRSGRG